ncbi:MAG TPA: hypothetical protein VJC07_03015 [Candidatus Nanoarchaeia archaeon]|nr:hypothetical protein [Candidatus Nanoarchaeia archaeon]
MFPFIVSRKDNGDVSYLVISDVTKEGGHYLIVDDDGKISKLSAEDLMANYLFDQFAPIPLEQDEPPEEEKP